jgi:hypothetical protein
MFSLIASIIGFVGLRQPKSVSPLADIPAQELIEAPAELA